MNRRPDAAERRTRFAWTVVPLSLILFCIVPVFLWSRTNHPNGVEASSEDSRAHPPADVLPANKFLSQAKAYETAYYVDSRGGDDANPGTNPLAPWKTLEKVNATTFHPGDEIMLRSSSVWRGQLWPKGSGTEGHPIRVDTYGGE